MNSEIFNPRGLITFRNIYRSNLEINNRCTNYNPREEYGVKVDRISHNYLIDNIFKNTKSQFDIKYRKILYFLEKYNFYYSVHPGEREIDVNVIEADKIVGNGYAYERYTSSESQLWLVNTPDTSHGINRLYNSLLREMRIWEGTELWEFINYYEICFIYYDGIENYKYNLRSYLQPECTKTTYIQFLPSSDRVDQFCCEPSYFYSDPKCSQMIC